VAVPGVVLFPGVAGHFGSLQADGGGAGVVGGAAAVDDSDFHVCFQGRGEGAGGWDSVCVDNAGGVVGVEFFLNVGAGVGEQHGGECEFDFEGLFSAAGSARGDGDYDVCGFSDFGIADGGVDGVVSICAERADCFLAVVCVAGVWGRHGKRVVVVGVDGAVSRCAVYRAVHSAIRALFVAGGFQNERVAGKFGEVADFVFVESDGGGDRWVSLVDFGRAESDRSVVADGVRIHGGGVAGNGDLEFPADGEVVRGHYLKQGGRGCEMDGCVSPVAGEWPGGGEAVFVGV
jgi:hypothetical protein